MARVRRRRRRQLVPRPCRPRHRPDPSVRRRSRVNGKPVPAGLPEQFQRFDVGFLRWYWHSGYQADFISDDDLEHISSARQLSRYRLIVFAGHEEYVTSHTFDLITAYRNAGGNLAFLSANNFFYKVKVSGNTMTGRIPWRERRPARGGAHRRAVRRLGRGQLSEPALPHHQHRGRALAVRGHGPARRQQRRQLRDRGRRAELRLAPAHARPGRDPERARARQAGRDDDLHPRPLDGVRRRRHQLPGERPLARSVTLLLQSLEPPQRRDQR